jgi:hypothetical protein
VVPPDDDIVEELDDLPQGRRPPDKVLTVYHLPARLRLVVVAPAGKVTEIDVTAIERLLDCVVPGLGRIAAQERPRIRVWPAQLSYQGFVATFVRRTHKSEPEGQPSRWVLAAGRAMAGGQTILLGLALWTDEPNSLGRVQLEQHQWLDVLRLSR